MEKFNYRILFDTILSQTNDLVMVIDHQGLCTYCSQTLLDFLNKRSNELQNRKLNDFLPEEVSSELFRNIDIVQMAQHTIETTLMLKINRNMKSFNAKLSPVPNGDILLVLQSTCSLAEEEPRVFDSNIIMGVPVVVFKWGIEPGFPVKYVSPSINHFGYTQEDFLSGKVNYMSQFIHPDDREHMLQEALENREKKIEYGIDEYRVIGATGEVRWILDITKGFYNNPYLAAIGFIIDITGRKNLEIEREKLIKELEAKNRDLKRFDYTISHELKTPLITIQGFLGLFLEDFNRGDLSQAQSYLQRVFNATRIMNVLLQDLLAFSRLEQTTILLKELRIGSVMLDAVQYIERKLQEFNITLTISPQLLGPETPIVHGDHARLVEVFVNLFDNAIKYRNKQVPLHIDVGVDYRENERVFFIRDNGIGIPPEFTEKIFAMFEKLNPQSAGVGIGLAIVRRIIDLHGGYIWAESEGKGKGTTFYVILP